LKIYISRHSVATQLRCGGIRSNQFITNFPQNVQVKKFWKSVDIWRRYEQKYMWFSFLAHPVFSSKVDRFTSNQDQHDHKWSTSTYTHTVEYTSAAKMLAVLRKRINWPQKRMI